MRGGAVSAPFVIWTASSIIKWWQIVLGFWYFFEGCLERAAWKQQRSHKWSGSHPPANRPSHQGQVCKQSAWALRPGRGAPRLQAWRGVSHSSGSLFLPLRPCVENPSTTFLSLWGCWLRQGSLLTRKRKALSRNPQGVGGRVGAFESCALPTPNTATPVPLCWDVPVGPRPEEPLGSAPSPQVLLTGCFRSVTATCRGLSIRGLLSVTI